MIQTTEVDPPVSEAKLLEEISQLRETRSAREIEKLLASCTILWFAWEFALSERQAIDVLFFFGERTPESVSMIKRSFAQWFEQLRQ